MSMLKQSTNRNVMVFMTDAADNASGKTGLTLTITASKDGAAFGSITPTVTDLGNGWYNLALTTTHTNTLGDLALHITGSGAVNTDMVFEVLEALPGGNLTATSVQSIWDALTSALTTSGSIGKRLADDIDATISSRATQTSVDTIDDFLDTEIAAIKAKTDNLPTDPADASDIASSFSTVNTKLDTIDDFLDTEIAAIKAKTDNLPTDPADASDIASSFSTVNGKLDTIDDFLDTEIAAIKAKTDNLPSDPADASDIAASFSTVNTKLDAIDDFVDTEVSAIKAKTDNLPADTATVLSDIASDISLLPGPDTARNENHNFSFPVFSTADGSPLPAIPDLAIEVSKDGGAFTATSNASTEISDGWYKILFTATEMNCELLAIRVTGTGAREQTIVITTQEPL